MVIQEEKMLDKSFNYSVPHSQPPLFHPGLYNLAQIINTVTLLPIPPPSPPKQKTAEDSRSHNKDPISMTMSAGVYKYVLSQHSPINIDSEKNISTVLIVQSLSCLFYVFNFC